jgi:cation:H+ antiporter
VLLAFFLIVIGIGLLVWGGEWLVRGAVALAVLVNLTPAVIGLTVVAVGTSIPELAVSAIATWNSQADMAVGNAVGSNIFNILAILGVASLIRPLVIGGNTIRLEYPVLAAVTALCVAVSFDGYIRWYDGLLFVAIYVCFTAYLVRLVRRQMNEAETTEFDEEIKDLLGPAEDGPSPIKSVFFVVAGVVLLALGAQSTVTGASEVAKAFGISERIIGLTIVAAGTGLPELVTSLVSSYRGRDDVAIGNVIGSNLFNILGVLGINGLIAPLVINEHIINSDNLWMLAITVLLFPILFTGRRIVRGEGVLLLVLYVVYVTQLILRKET